MNIQLTSSMLHPRVESTMKALAADTKQDVAWTSDLDHILRPAVQSSVWNLPDDGKLHTAKLVDLHHHQQENKKKNGDALIAIATSGTALLKDQFGELGAPLDGFEFVIASARTFDAWSNPDRKGVIKPSLTTATAVVEGLEFASNFFAPLQSIAPHLKTAGIVLKFGDAAYQIYLSEHDDSGSTASKSWPS